MKKTFLLVTLLFAAAGASAQQYKWVDKNGRVGYGDVPPPGATVTPLRPPPPPSAPPASAAQGPLSAAEKEAAFRKRREDAEKERQKGELAAKEAQAKQQNCARSREYLRTLESGLRVARTDAKGERYYLDDAAVARETTQARQSVQQWCH